MLPSTPSLPTSQQFSNQCSFSPAELCFAVTFQWEYDLMRYVLKINERILLYYIPGKPFLHFHPCSLLQTKLSLSSLSILFSNCFIQSEDSRCLTWPWFWMTRGHDIASIGKHKIWSFKHLDLYAILYMLRPYHEMYGCHKRHSANCKLIISSLVHPRARH